ncbi:hypothetical protein PG994_014353 [Apiospora phragmitis]|uniref:Uncharacterized protein n=1 Tax=Apiospora phragmitis TaxID=2905665 RepID=A0ABR1T5P0_9PEZI
MQSSLAILAVAGAVAAKAIPRDDGPIAIAVGDALGSHEMSTKASRTSTSAWNDQITSIGPDAGTTCTIFENYGCSARSLGGIVNPGIYNLNDWNFNDIGTY